MILTFGTTSQIEKLNPDILIVFPEVYETCLFVLLPADNKKKSYNGAIVHGQTCARMNIPYL